MTWLLAFGGTILRFVWHLILWIPRQLHLIKQEKKAAELEVIRLLEEYESSLKQQVDRATGAKQRQALEEEVEGVIAAKRGYYRKMLERTLERSDLPSYAALVANGERVLQPENKSKLTEAVTRLDVLPPPATAEEFIASATAKIALERYDEALADLNRALDLRPDYLLALNNRGITYTRLKRYDEALADLNRALEPRPDDPEARNSRGVTYYHLERYEQALADFNEALKLKPDDPQILSNRATTYYHLERYEEALAEDNKAVQLRPHSPEALTSRGITYDKLGRYDEALADYDQALNLRPDYLDALNNRGVTYGNLQRYAEALADFNRAIQLRPDDAEILYNLACLFSLRSQADEAVAYLEKAISLKEKFRQKAATDSDFDNIRDDPRFRRLVAGA